MNVIQRSYADVQRDLKRLRRSLFRFTEVPDWTAKCGIRIQLDDLENDLREFARCQHGLGLGRDSTAV